MDTYRLEDVCGDGPQNNVIEISLVEPGKPLLAEQAITGRRHCPLLVRFVNQMCANAFGVPVNKLLCHSRGNAKSSRSRQSAMYLLHTGLSYPLNEIATIYQKDRTTVGHACKVIEELRDCPEFDRRISDFEEILATVLELRISDQGKV